jgi:hypothetical protein
MDLRGKLRCVIGNTRQTHAHADHITASNYLHKHFKNSKLGIGSGITKVQEVFQKVYSLESFKTGTVNTELGVKDRHP